MQKKKSVSLPLSKAVEGFTLACRARKLSEHTIADYANTYRKFQAHVGDLSLSEITSATIAAFLASQTSVSEKTVFNYHIGLSALWTWAIQEGYAGRHVVRMVKKPKPAQLVIQPYTETEIRAMFTGIRQNQDRDRAILLLLLDTGIRASELCGIQRRDLDLTEYRVKVLGKGNKERMLPFSSRTASSLFRYLANLPAGANPFEFSRTSLGHHLARIGKRAGIRDVHPHRFRHTFAITYLRNGGDPYTLKQILGHSTMEMVNRYLALAQIDLDTAHKRASPVEGWRL